jgi:hypothetical protein
MPDLFPRLLYPGCRLHGPGCQTPWGYDRAHTDSQRPYTLDELAVRDAGPHFFAYPDGQAYESAWRLWVALRRDGRLTGAERDAAVLARLELAERRGDVDAAGAAMVRWAYLASRRG